MPRADDGPWVLSPLQPRCITVNRRALARLLLAPLLLAVQGLHAQGYAPLTAQLKAIAAAANDAGRDSASANVKRLLGAILGSDTAFSARFKDVPISQVNAPDGAFRLFTWNVQHSDGSFLYEGFLLVKQRKGQALYALRDMTDHITRPAAALLSPENWYGAVYYEVVPVKHGGHAYYTLLGWKGFSGVETRKVMEVLDLGGPKPKFGAALFPAEKPRSLRQVFAYSAQGSMLLRWDASRKAIVLDHLSPTRPELAGQPAYMAPDMSFDSYTWDKGRWRLERDIDLRGPGGRPYKAPPKDTP